MQTAKMVRIFIDIFVFNCVFLLPGVRYGVPGNVPDICFILEFVQDDLPLCYMYCPRVIQS